MVLDTSTEAAESRPTDFPSAKYKGKLPAVNADAEKLRFSVVISPLDCRGCGVCANTCPASALTMTPIENVMPRQQQIFDYAYDKVQFTQGAEKIDPTTCGLKELQLRFPYMEFPGSCPGCGESNIMKLLTALYGESLILSIGVGCCLVWMHYGLIRPFNLDKEARGIATCSSLFEDNSVFGWGVMLTREAGRANLKAKIDAAAPSIADMELKAAVDQWITGYGNTRQSIETSRALREAVGIQRLCTGENRNHPQYVIPESFTKYTRAEDRVLAEYIVANNVYLQKTSHWIVGGDGWAYDIDFGGVDHVLASRDRVRLLIFVNHCFANTGGQKSKATPIGSVMKNAYGGVEAGEKKLGLMMMSYHDVYVAQVALGANRIQAMKAIKEANEYNGSAIVLAYCPCISHMVVGGLTNQERQQKLAVETGLWPIYRYNPSLAEHRLVMDCSKPSKPVSAFMETEQRFGVLEKRDAAKYARLKAKLQADTEAHWASLSHLATQ